MNATYVDTSVMVAIALGEPGGDAAAARLEGFDRVFSSNLLEAEFRAALVREEVPSGAELLSWIDWIIPDRPLSEEIDEVLAASYLRGADLWHLACALYLAEEPEKLTFLTLDRKQAEAAAVLGFPT